jgi:hypothetical protein
MAQAPEIMREFCSLLFPRDDRKSDLTSTLRPDFHPLSTLRRKESCKVFDGDLRRPEACSDSVTPQRLATEFPHVRPLRTLVNRLDPVMDAATAQS